MKKTSTTFARGIVYLMGFAALAVCLILLPELAREEAVANPTANHQTVPFFIMAYILTIPFFVALHQVLQLLKFLDQGRAFSEHSVRALKNIKNCAIVFSGMVAAVIVGLMVWVRSMDLEEDITGLITISFIFIFASSIIATFAAVLQRLLRDAIAMKSENDLTV